MNIKRYISKTKHYLSHGDWQLIAKRAGVSCPTASKIKLRTTISEMTDGERKAFDAYVYYVEVRQKELSELEAKMSATLVDSQKNNTLNNRE